MAASDFRSFSVAVIVVIASCCALLGLAAASSYEAKSSSYETGKRHWSSKSYTPGHDEPPHRQHHDSAYGKPPSPYPSRHKRAAPADYYGPPPPPPPPSRPGYDKEDGDYFGSRTSYEPARYFVEYVVNLRGKDGGTYEASKAWRADCNGHSYGYDHAWITAIWDDYGFTDLDYVKCEGPKSDYDRGSKNGGGYKLDLYDAKVIDFDHDAGKYSTMSYKPTECLKGYLLTALWADDRDFESVRYGKCVRLDAGLVDYSTCDNVVAGDHGRQGGSYDAQAAWNVECPREWAAVGLKKSTSKPVYPTSYGSGGGGGGGSHGHGDGATKVAYEYLRCCKLIPPHPPAAKYEHY